VSLAAQCPVRDIDPFIVKSGAYFMFRLSTRGLALLFALTTLVSAFLLFQVQPLLSKFLLPWFGGTPAVWTTCVLFFQAALFGGYLYAHLSESLFSERLQAVVHIVLLAAAVVVLPITPDNSWKPTADDQPILRILAVLTVCIGIPYFLLSSTGPLVSAWFARSFPGRSPYRLYALSNFGSLLALLTYPFVVAPALSIRRQASWWSWAFVVFAICSAASALSAARHRKPAGSERLRVLDAKTERGAAGRKHLRWLAWVGLPAFASLTFLATTNVVCQDVAVVPFLWIAPLSLYLLSFIITFDHERWYNRQLYCSAFLLLLALGPLYLIAVDHWDFPYAFVHELVLYLAAMFCVCMICHGELVALRPPAYQLTSFYLCVAAGGAIGGLFVSVIAPLIFANHYEWAIVVAGAGILSAVLWLGPDFRDWLVRQRRLLVPIVAVAVLVAVSIGREIVLGDLSLVWQGRNFYGVVTVSETVGDESEKQYRQLANGRITHGIQFTAPTKRHLPTTYYGPESGVGQTLSFYQQSAPGLRIGAIGLGVGTLAAYVRESDTIRFYEINPHVIHVANECFTFVPDCRGKCEVVLGDARLTLEEELADGRLQQFDVLVLDAFSGDAIPMHLLTREAFEVYDRHLDGDGAICVHISNQYLDLSGVVRRLADSLDFETAHVNNPELDRDQRGIYSSDWIVLSRNRELIQAIDKHVVDDAGAKIDEAPLWTDDWTDLWRILK
jgi:hypothetical protein